jgi:hypothetical protein
MTTVSTRCGIATFVTTGVVADRSTMVTVEQLAYVR